MTTYTTSQFDAVDGICHRFYGATAGTVEAVLAVNPGLADMAPILPPGVLVFMPNVPDPAEAVSLIRLWEAAQ